MVRNDYIRQKLSTGPKATLTFKDRLKIKREVRRFRALQRACHCSKAQGQIKFECVYTKNSKGGEKDGLRLRKVGQRASFQESHENPQEVC
jgi:hypothetical protein